MTNKIILATPTEYKIYCALSPIGPYFPKGFSPIDL